MIVMIRVAHFQSSHRADACNCKAVVNNGDGAVDEPVGLAGPVLGKGAVEAEVPVLSPVRVSHLPLFHCEQEDYQEDYDYDNDSDDGISAQ